MIRLSLIVAILLLLISVTAYGAAGKEAKLYEGSINYKDYDGEASEDDADRGVLGVKYAVATDVMGKTHVIVMTVVKGGPAAQAHLRRGDRIMEIDGTLVADLTRKQVGPRMRGEPGTRVTFMVRRGWDDFPLTITRGGLTKLPDKAFQERLVQAENGEERDARIKALSQRLSASYPTIWNAIESDNYPEALLQLKRAAKMDPGSLEVQLLYALVLDKQSKFDQAQSIFEDLVAQKPAWVEAWRSLALCYEEKGDYANAVKALKKAVPLIDDKRTESLMRQRILELSSKASQP